MVSGRSEEGGEVGPALELISVRVPDAVLLPIEPISVRVPDAVRMTGLSRSGIYQLIASGDSETAKVGRLTVVLVASLRSLVVANRKVIRVRQ